MAPADETEVYHRMHERYKRPEHDALRAAWGAYPATPAALQAWPGFVTVTNAFLDSDAADDRSAAAAATDPVAAEAEESEPVGASDVRPAEPAASTKPVVASEVMEREASVEGGADEPKQTSQIASMDDDDGNVAFIPDLEDEEEDLGKQVAVAQNYQRQLPTLMELEEELDMQLPSTAEVGIDLSVLQSFLTPQEMCQEEDVPWDIDFELQTIASEMQKELEQREGKALPGEIKKVGGGVSKKEGGGAAAATGGGVERKRGGVSKAKDEPADLS